MDVSTFYALFSATCFTLVGLWWTVIHDRPGWMRDESMRRAVGGVYLSFLLPAVMGLFAQVGGSETPMVWRVSFVVVAIIGALSTLSLLARSRDQGASAVASRVAAVVVYVVIAVIGLAPEVAEPLDLTPVQAEAVLLILLVVLGHATVWRFMIENAPAVPAGAEPTGDEPAGAEPDRVEGRHR
jgi:hypothetical protein